MSDLFDRLEQATAFVRGRIGDRAPTVGLILGSGLGPFADTLDDAVAIDYAEIPHFPVSRVVGHAGKLVVGRKSGITCAAMQGRVHYYEGHDLQTVTFPARAMVRLGCSTLIITNAAGGISKDLRPGTLMLLRDHLNLMGQNPLRGDNDDRLGPRFPDMTHTYRPELRVLARKAASDLGFAMPDGVYAALSGPTYETPAEITMLQRLGADAVGMSTVPEAIVANHMGARVLGISCITNAAAGLGHEALSHDEVTDTAARVRDTFEALLSRILQELAGA